MVVSGVKNLGVGDVSPSHFNRILLSGNKIFNVFYPKIFYVLIGERISCSLPISTSLI